jgi:ureidoglycolate lyase
MSIAVVRHATPESFRPYGKVVTGPVGDPLARTPEFSYWSDLASYVIDTATEIGLCTVYRREPRRVTVVERHMRTPEILIPADAPFDLPVLKEGETSDRLAVFRVMPGQAVIIGAGVWHGACLPVGRDQATYFVLFRRRTPQRDVIKKEIPPMHVSPAPMTVGAA